MQFYLHVIPNFLGHWSVFSSTLPNPGNHSTFQTCDKKLTIEAFKNFTTRICYINIISELLVNVRLFVVGRRKKSRNDRTV